VSVVPPSRVAERLNRQSPMDRRRRYFTLVYGVADPSSGQFQCVMAGHPAPVRLPRTGSPAPVAGAGLPVGMIDMATCDDETLTLHPGDRLYCYTDGAIEALNAAEDEFGLDRLLAEIDRWRGLPLRAGLDRIAAAVRGWSSGPLKDDISLIAIERTG